jgi:hypothetical protein
MTKTWITDIEKYLSLKTNRQWGRDVGRCPSNRQTLNENPYSYGANYPSVFASYSKSNLWNYCFAGSAKLLKVPINVYMGADSALSASLNGLDSVSIFSPYNWAFTKDWDHDGILDGDRRVGPYNGFNPLHRGSANCFFSDLHVSRVPKVDFVKNKSNMWGTQNGFYRPGGPYR